MSKDTVRRVCNSHVFQMNDVFLIVITSQDFSDEEVWYMPKNLRYVEHSPFTECVF